MKAIILAAGYATRLYPLTINKPKSLLEIGGKTVLDYIVEDIENIECIDEIIIISNDKFYNNFETWSKETYCKKPIKVINDGTTSDENKLGAIGDINLVINNCNIDDDIFIVAGDNLYSFSLQTFFENYEQTKQNCILSKKIKNTNELKRMGVVQVDKENKVIGFEEKPENPKSDIAVFASYIYSKDTIPLINEYIDQGNNPDAPGYFIAWLFKRKDVYAHIIEGECYDIGTHETYNQVKAKFEMQNVMRYQQIV
ncbi:MAG: sugar phosphate nucleotidyltransferase [Bacillota bacterium]|nr:sugar phosphate nucleotidyltransferase [Bacillota bacterium]